MTSRFSIKNLFRGRGVKLFPECTLRSNNRKAVRKVSRHGECVLPSRPQHGHTKQIIKKTIDCVLSNALNTTIGGLMATV